MNKISENVAQKCRREIWVSVESQVSRKVRDYLMPHVWIPVVDILWHRMMNLYNGVLNEER